MTKATYRVSCFVVVHIAIFIIAGSGVLNGLSAAEAILLAPVWFFGTLVLILGSERLLGIDRGDRR